MVQAQTDERQRTGVKTKSVTMYPDEWHEVVEDAWKRRIPMSENMRRIVRAYFDMDADDSTQEVA